jgi:hypothetical protein
MRDIKTLLESQCKDFRFEDNTLTDEVTKFFVDNDKVDMMAQQIKMLWVGPGTFEVLPINDKPETKPKSDKPSPLELVAEMLDIPMKKTEDGETVYLEEIKLGRVVGAAKYSERKPTAETNIVDTIKSMLSDIDRGSRQR